MHTHPLYVLINIYTNACFTCRHSCTLKNAYYTYFFQTWSVNAQKMKSWGYRLKTHFQMLVHFLKGLRLFFLCCILIHHPKTSIWNLPIYSQFLCHPPRYAFVYLHPTIFQVAYFALSILDDLNCVTILEYNSD